MDTDLDICDFVTSGEASGEADDEYYCAPAGTYEFQTDFTLPETALSNTNFAVNGVSFRIYVLINNDLTCNAQFTTVRADTGTSAMEVSMLGFVALIVSGFSAFAIQNRRRRTVAQVDLKAAEQPQHDNDAKKRVHFEDHYVTL